ncbi:T-cell-interacting, activating receptor on myeloid cells protein 1-like isoform X2 [Numida meleagris]|uniref:T-cell-interacting, activating receptor on myeloid cells protein 1-like isoform X2 n=1 Tax=Numida meleagris TaxID=8996 RepID=UPI000B3E1071|nr:T-cell-interacting, activating receptor on myeloid cells protein 1-like isoform X2 [Numida meleagris]
MAPVALALILGWCLVAASRAQHVPQPSLSLHPRQGVSLGDTVTLRCHLPRMAAWVWLYQDRGWTHNKYKDKEQDVGEFSFISTSREHAGTYRCQYHVSEPLGISEQSDPVELVVTDHSYPPPSISISPKEGVGMGTNVTIRCWNRDDGVTFFLHKDGLLSPTQHQDLDGGGTATFIIFGVTPADAGTYRCSYRPWAHPFVSSPLGDSVTLQLTPTPAPPGANGESCGILAVAVAGGCVTALTFSLVLIIFFLLAAHRRQTWRTVNPGGEWLKWFHPPEMPPSVPCCPFHPRTSSSAPHFPVHPVQFPLPFSLVSFWDPA